MATANPSYGTPNWEMIGRWLEMSPEDDGPFWAVNLMKYRPVADYGDGADEAISGREADDVYAPLGPLAAIGAMVAFHGDVTDQALGHPAWERIGIVRYPSRAAFFAMQQRDDFKSQHRHKEAGMEVTIVMACHPDTFDPDAGASGSLVLTVERGGSGPSAPAPDGVTPVVAFTVEGVIVGDERSFDRVRFDRAADGAALAALVAVAAEADEAHLVVVDPAIDRLIASITTAPGAGEG